MTRHARVFLAAGIAACLVAGAAAAAGDGGPPKPAATAVPPLDDLTATRDRPLFSPTRRPPPAPVAPVVAAPIAEPTTFPYELVGIVLGPETRIAMFRKGEGRSGDEGAAPSDVVRRKIGEKLDQWMIDTIAVDYVVLQGNAKRVRLRLFSQKDTGIRIGSPGGGEEPVPDPSTAPETSADGAPSGPVDEEIVPAGPPKVIPPTPRTQAPPRKKPGPPGSPVRNPAPNKPRP